MDAPPAAVLPKPCCVCDAPGGKHCTKCKSRHYCSKACQLVDWNEGGHKAQCKQLVADFQDRLLDLLMPLKVKIMEEPPIVEDVAPAAGLKAAPRLSGARTDKVAKAGAPNDDTHSWRGTCAVCLDQLPVGSGTQRFYSCCCKKICLACADKCEEYDERCPLCRAPGPKSDAETLRWLQEHADEGNADAQVLVGNAYGHGEGLKKSSTKRALKLFKLAAAQGNAMAQVKLGLCHVLGEGVEINLKTAEQWYRRAAEQGYPDGQYLLGTVFCGGEGVAQSFDEAVRWYRLGAAQDHAAALYCLGNCYADGKGVPEDLDEALRLHKRATAQGHAWAAEMAAEVSQRLAARASG